MHRVPLQVIAAALGHADTRITERHYAHLLPSYVADQIGANLPRLGIDIENIRELKVGAQSNEGVTQSGDVIGLNGSFDEKWRLALALCNSCA